MSAAGRGEADFPLLARFASNPSYRFAQLGSKRLPCPRWSRMSAFRRLS